MEVGGFQSAGVPGQGWGVSGLADQSRGGEGGPPRHVHESIRPSRLHHSRPKNVDSEPVSKSWVIFWL